MTVGLEQLPGKENLIKEPSVKFRFADSDPEYDAKASDV